MADAKRALETAVGEDTGGSKFKFAKFKAKPQVRQIWKTSDLNIGSTELVCTPPAPQYVVKKLLPCDSIVAIDVETHELVPEYGELVPWSRDQFGFESKVTQNTLSTLRVIQLGWAVGTSIEDMDARSIMVRPDGFKVSSAATKKHGISQEKVESGGVPLDEALQVMVTDVLTHCSRGARVVAHNLPFDAGLIYEELGRAGLSHLQKAWADAVRGGIDTMDPDIGNWARSMLGFENKSRNIPVALKTLVIGFVPDAKTMLQKHHTADGDAAMHFALCRKLVNMCMA